MPSNHFDDDGNARMVDVSEKPATVRIATASATIRMDAAAAETIRRGSSRKGDVLGVARLAAINATKWTPHLIPLCHAIAIEGVEVEFDWVESPSPNQADADRVGHRLRCLVTCRTTARTGIEMEALAGASTAALTVYDMLKSVDRGMEIGPIRLEHKQGGRSGVFSRD